MTRAACKAIALLPLDNRPATCHFPQEIGSLAGWEVVTPPPGLLGDLTRPASCAELIQWLVRIAPEVEGAIIALDTLIYGGLLPARRSIESLELLSERLVSLEILADRSFPLYAFAVTLRIANSNVAEEEKPYWADYGSLIYRWSFHADRHAQLGDAADAEQARLARASIPDAIVNDYLATRQRNLAVHHQQLDLAAKGLFKVLCLTQDDTAAYGFNQAEKRELAARKVPGVLFYPGADEVAATLVGRWINEQAGKQPGFHLSAVPPSTLDVVTLYEDRPLRDTATCQVLAVGGRIAKASDAADLDLWLNGPASYQGDLALGTHLAGVADPPRDLRPLVARLRCGPPLALADVAYANGADPELWNRVGSFPLANLAAFAGWNTAGNTLGTVTSLASAYLTGPRQPKVHRQFILNRLADDLLYQAILRPRLQREGQPIATVAAELGARLTTLWQEQFPWLPIRKIAASLPWNRLFEAAIMVIE
ncbi:MAG: DUF4127 family protein [Cyanobacteria bacterium NC_groundwater_1444_Ag_S-0.65um_54_12]|nr:DUF4127 family protein [Cyanobacteria bacterium NC_groundwater_1444_Ag_S-0.65um_54_12]